MNYAVWSKNEKVVNWKSILKKYAHTLWARAGKFHHFWVFFGRIVFKILQNSPKGASCTSFRLAGIAIFSYIKGRSVHEYIQFLADKVNWLLIPAANVAGSRFSSCHSGKKNLNCYQFEITYLVLYAVYIHICSLHKHKYT